MDNLEKNNSEATQIDLELGCSNSDSNLPVEYYSETLIHDIINYLKNLLTNNSDGTQTTNRLMIAEIKNHLNGLNSLATTIDKHSHIDVIASTNIYLNEIDDWLYEQTYSNRTLVLHIIKFVNMLNSIVIIDQSSSIGLENEIKRSEKIRN